MNVRHVVLAFLTIFALGAWYVLSSDGQVVADDSAMIDVSAPELSGDAFAGETAFNANCASCHGSNASGRNGLGPPLVHKIYEPSHHGDMSFVLAAENGVHQHHWRFGNMPPVEGVNAQDIEKIITYVRSLQRANGIN